MHSVLGLQIEGDSYKSGFCAINLSGNTVEAKAIQPWSDNRWLLVITTPVRMSIRCWCSRRVNKGYVPSWRRLKVFGVLTADEWSSRERRAASRCSALYDPAVTCPWRGLGAGKGSDERPTAAESLSLGLRRERSPEKAAAVCGEQKETEPTRLSFSHPFPMD